MREGERVCPVPPPRPAMGSARPHLALPSPPGPDAAIMAAALLILGALLGAEWLPAPLQAMQVTVSDPRVVALLFQPVELRCSYQSSATSPPIVTWKYKSFCPTVSGSGGNQGGSTGGWGGAETPMDAATACPDSARTVRIVATKQGSSVSVGEFYQGRSVTISDGAVLSLGPAAWGDSGVYVCTVSSTQDLEGNNEGAAELVVLASLPEVTELLPGTMRDWLFVVLVVLAVLLLGALLGLCWCQCCPHTCCCYVRCPCCPRRCCCPEALYLAGKAATSGGAQSIYGGGLYPPPVPIAMGPIGNGFSGASVGGHSSQVPLLRDADGSAGSAPRPPPPSTQVLRYLEEGLGEMDPPRRYPPSSGAGAPSDISSLHEAPDSWTPPPRSRPPRSNSPPPPPRGRWRSAEDLLGGSPPSPPPLFSSSSRRPPRSRSRDDLLWEGGAAPLPRLPPVGPPGPPRRLKKNAAVSRDSLVV